MPASHDPRHNPVQPADVRRRTVAQHQMSGDDAVCAAHPPETMPGRSCRRGCRDDPPTPRRPRCHAPHRRLNVVGVQAGQPLASRHQVAATTPLGRLRDALRHRLPSARGLPAAAPVSSLAGMVARRSANAGTAPSPLSPALLRRFLGVAGVLARAALWDACRLTVFWARDPVRLIRGQRRRLGSYGRALRFAWLALRRGNEVRAVQRGAGTQDAAPLEVEDLRDLVVEPVDISVLTFAGRYRGRPAVFKAAADGPGRAALRRERAGLVLARRACRRAGLAAQVATCLGAADQPPLLVQQRLGGRSPPLRQRGRILPEAELRARVAAAMAPLMGLHAQARHVPDGPDHALIFRDLPDCLDRHPALAAPLGPALRALQRWPARSGMGAVLVHGDYWLGNLLFDANGAVCGIVDWERCRADGCPGLDALHLAAASYGVWRARPLALVFEEIWTRRWSSAFLEEHVAAVTAALGLSEEDVARLAMLLWLGYVRSSVLAMDSPAEDWLRLNVVQPARSLPAWAG